MKRADARDRAGKGVFLKRNLLRVIRSAGGFALCRRRTAQALRILCYHGISLDDEHKFRSKLFMSPGLFRHRMQWLSSRGFEVLDLGDAVSALYEGSLPKNAVAITFDDGWYGIYKYALPILVEFGFKATLYASTYYSEKETFVFNVFVPYLFWRSDVEQLDLGGLGYGLKGRFYIDDPEQRAEAMRQLIHLGDEKLIADDRQALAMNLADQLGDDGKAMERNRVMTFMNLNELSDWEREGMDIQLHTHTHKLPWEDETLARQEIERNRQALARVADHELTHLCYPSGIYDPRLFPCLETMGIKTATTCEAGLNHKNTHPLKLRRFLDGENVSDIEFHAEMDGMLELLRKGRSGVTRARAR